MSLPDPFNTRKIREQTLRMWRENPQRFREDANTEEDYARGYYRDRVIIELAQNAADAAPESGGELRFSLRRDTRAASGWILVAENTGQPLTADGVASLSGLRTSVKSAVAARVDEAAVGHFGVGFSAVRAVSDEISVRSGDGGVRFSLEQTVHELGEIATAAQGASREFRAEFERRGGELPILRLPRPDSAVNSRSYATAIKLLLRDESAVDLVRGLLADVDDRFLIALPRLHRIEIEIEGEEPRSVADVEKRWCITRHTGTVPAELLETLPVEQRERARWAVTWATERHDRAEGGGLLDLVAAQSVAGARETLFAPTPTDEPISLPGFVIATIPLEPTRRRVRPGPVADWVISRVGAIAALHAQKLADPLELVPTGLPVGEVDAALHAQIRESLARTPLLRTLAGGAIAPSDATVIVLSAGAQGSLAGALLVNDATALAELASGLDGIVDIPRHRLTQAAAVGVRARSVVDVVAEMPAGRTMARWQETYSALSGLTREVGGEAALANLPVPLAEGRVVAGVRGLYLVTDDLPIEVLARIAAWGLRIVHPQAGHPLLETLGAARVFAGQLLEEPEVRERALAPLNAEDEPEEAGTAAEVILHLVASAVQHRGAQGEVSGPILPWLPDIPLRSASGEIVGAGGIRLGSSRAQSLYLADELLDLDPEWEEQWPAEVWRAVGVRDGLVTVRQTVHLDSWDVDASIDAVLDDASIGILDLLDAYLDELVDYWFAGDWDGAAEPESLTFELAALADLDIVAPEAWGQVEREVLAWLDRNEQPVPVPGREEPFPHYLRWWLERR